MPRLISCAETIPAVRDRTKTETRRLGWWQDRNGRRLVMPGDHLIVCGKIMGRNGAPLRRLAEIRIGDVRREPLEAIDDDAVEREGCTDIVRAYLAGWRRPETIRSPARGDMAAGFVAWYCEAFRCRPDTEITVLGDWTYITSYEGPYAEVAA